jgi:hypothetical protein
MLARCASTAVMILAIHLLVRWKLFRNRLLQQSRKCQLMRLLKKFPKRLLTKLQKKVQRILLRRFPLRKTQYPP